MRRVIGWSTVGLCTAFAIGMMILIYQTGLRADEDPGSSTTIIPAIALLFGGLTVIIVSALVILRLIRRQET